MLNKILVRSAVWFILLCGAWGCETSGNSGGGEGEGEGSTEGEGEGGTEGEGEGSTEGEGEGATEGEGEGGTEGEGEGGTEGEGEGAADPACVQWSLLGSAARVGERIRLTGDEPDQVGAAWSAVELDLWRDFDLLFQLELGTKDEEGADGIAFVLAPGSATADVGEGLGYQGLAPSVVVELDTYPNDGEHLGGDLDDPLADHLAIAVGGNASHATGLPLTELPNVEDGKSHLLRVRWQAATHRLEAFLDDQTTPLLEWEADLVTDHLEGQSLVRFGLTASTGVLSNVQEFRPLRCSQAAGDEWVLVGAAVWEGAKIVLTPDEPNLAGAAWRVTPLELTRDFDLEFRVYLGDQDEEGADGMAFVLAAGDVAAEVGEGLGYQGIAPSVAVELDTYPNDGQHLGGDLHDPPGDHVAVDVGGSADHGVQPELPLTEVANLEDGQEHTLRLRWTAASTLLEVWLDGGAAPVLTYTADLATEYLEGQTRVRFGLTASTGELSNRHYFVPGRLTN